MNITATLSKDARKLTLAADAQTRAEIAEFENFGIREEIETLEHLILNSEFDWISPIETGDLTDAPMIGFRDEEGKVTEHWAFMDYQLRSFLTDLMNNGEAVFIS